MNNKKISGKTKKLIRLLLVFNIMLLAASWIYTAISYFNLPDIIPVHFGWDGKPDRFAEKNTNFVIPVISSVMFIFLTYLGQNPDSPLLNVPDAMRKNAELSQIFVQGMLTFVLLLFLNIVHATARVATEKQDSLSYFTEAILAGMFLYMIVFFIFAKRYSAKFNPEKQ